MMQNKLYAKLSGALLLICTLGGCGGGSTQEEGALTGTVRIDGSSTVYPITEAVAEEFMASNRGVQVTVGVSGTGGGFAKFGRGETDISDASRPIQASEAQLAQQNGIEFIELPVAYDGLVVVANPQNTWAECLTVDELRRIWETNSTVRSWSEVRPGFPNQPINLYGAGTDSGTYDYFTAAIVGEEGASRADFTASEDDNVLVQGVSGDPNALGFFGMAYYDENADRLKLLGVDDGNPANGDGCIQPSQETVENGTYQPLARPEFIYVNAERANDPAVEAFVEFYLENAPALVSEVGYVPLSSQAYELALQRFQNRTTGSVFQGGSQTGVRMEQLLQMGGSTADSVAADTAATPAASPQ
jgi:phosphate transport system substrate-binding protein